MQAALDGFCPFPTSLRCSEAEAGGREVDAVRAYKLGKQRYSYNEMQLAFLESGGLGRLETVSIALNITTDEIAAADNGGLVFDLTLGSGEKLVATFYLAYDEPVSDDGCSFKWPLVDRRDCQRNCRGPVMRPIKRYGEGKDKSSIYLAFDEAGTHVCEHPGGRNECRHFRVVAAFVDPATNQALGSATSPPIDVVANNDVPEGAGRFVMACRLPSSWLGWDGVALPPASRAAVPMLDLAAAYRCGEVPLSSGHSAKYASPSRTRRAAPGTASPTKVSPRRRSRAVATSERPLEGPEGPSPNHASPERVPPGMLHTDSLEQLLAHTTLAGRYGSPPKRACRGGSISITADSSTQPATLSGRQSPAPVGRPRGPCMAEAAVGLPPFLPTHLVPQPPADQFDVSGLVDDMQLLHGQRAGSVVEMPGDVPGGDEGGEDSEFGVDARLPPLALVPTALHMWGLGSGDLQHALEMFETAADDGNFSF